MFVSYSRKDGLEFARRLQALLEAEGLSLYRDLNDLEGGEDWWRQVEAAIRSVEHVVLVLSPAALRSPLRGARMEARAPGRPGRSRRSLARASSTSRICRAGWSARIATTSTFPRVARGWSRCSRGRPARSACRSWPTRCPRASSRAPRSSRHSSGSLLDARGEPVAITAALRGAGGYGKTALANALCHDSDIQDAFSDGILRVTLGEKPDDLVGRIADLIEILDRRAPGLPHSRRRQGRAGRRAR